jgi:hypothetical protein
MLLGDLDAAVTEQHRTALHRCACLQQSKGERVLAAVGVAVWNTSLLEYAL